MSLEHLLKSDPDVFIAVGEVKGLDLREGPGLHSGNFCTSWDAQRYCITWNADDDRCTETRTQQGWGSGLLSLFESIDYSLGGVEFFMRDGKSDGN